MKKNYIIHCINILIISQYDALIIRFRNADDIAEAAQDVTRDCNTPTLTGRDRPTLHEILMAEKSDFEAKVHRAARRKKWLKGEKIKLS